MRKPCGPEDVTPADIQEAIDTLCAAAGFYPYDPIGQRQFGECLDAFRGGLGALLDAERCGMAWEFYRTGVRLPKPEAVHRTVGARTE